MNHVPLAIYTARQKSFSFPSFGFSFWVWIVGLNTPFFGYQICCHWEAYGIRLFFSIPYSNKKWDFWIHGFGVLQVLFFPCTFLSDFEESGSCARSRRIGGFKALRARRRRPLLCGFLQGFLLAFIFALLDPGNRVDALSDGAHSP